MDYRDVYERIGTPLYTLEGMQRCVDDCLEKGYKDKIGINKEHRNMILHNYRKPTYTRPIILSDVKKTICELVRHTARSLYYEFLEKAKNENVNLIDVAPGFVEKNPELKYYKISYLRTIANLDDKKMLEAKDSPSVLSKFIKKAYDSMKMYTDNGKEWDFIEHACAEPIYEYDDAPESDMGINPARLIKKYKYSKRIYLNIANDKRGLKFIEEVLKKCIDKRIPCDLKPFFNNGTLDGTIIYAHNGNFGKMVSVMEEVIEEHPELLGSLGSPIITGGNVRSKDGNSYYAITHGGGNSKNNIIGTYNTIANGIINTTYLIACLKFISDYFPRFVNKFRDNATIIKLMHSQFSTEEEIMSTHDYSHVDEANTIREEVAKVLLSELPKEGASKEEKEKTQRRYKEKYDRLVYYFSAYLGRVTSVINFGDMMHQNIPMFKDESFLLFEEQELSQGRKF